MEEDLKIWERIRSGDASALKALHERYFYQLHLYGKKLCHNSTLLDEAVSDCFIKLWTRRSDLVITRSFKSYLFLMLRNGLIDLLRRKDHTLYFEEGSIPDLPDEEMQEELDRYAKLYSTLEKLPEQRRRILELAVFDSFSYAQIAEKLHISVNTVKTQMGRAYRFIKEELDPRSLQLLFMLTHYNR
jgi:RNA polymerase sigma-70 factor (ECF subfamily)